MTRKRIRHEQLLNESKRSSIFTKRTDGLLKKAEQLCILCGVEIGVVAHKQGGESNAVLWPSPEVFGERLQKFMNFPPADRAKKMVTHEKYMEQAVAMEMENLHKARREVEVKEARQLLAGLESGAATLEGMNLVQLKAVRGVADDMLKTLYKRVEELNADSSTGAPKGKAVVGGETSGMMAVETVGSGSMQGGYGEVRGGCSSTAVTRTAEEGGGASFLQSLVMRNEQWFSRGFGAAGGADGSGSSSGRRQLFAKGLGAAPLGSGGASRSGSDSGQYFAGGMAALPLGAGGAGVSRSGGNLYIAGGMGSVASGSGGADGSGSSRELYFAGRMGVALSGSGEAGGNGGAGNQWFGMGIGGVTGGTDGSGSGNEQWFAEGIAAAPPGSGTAGRSGSGGEQWFTGGIGAAPPGSGIASGSGGGQWFAEGIGAAPPGSGIASRSRSGGGQWFVGGIGAVPPGSGTVGRSGDGGGQWFAGGNRCGATRE